MTDKLALEKAIDFIETLTRDPLLVSDDIEMTLADVQRHARIELASIRKVLDASPKSRAKPVSKLVEMIRERFGSSFDNEATFDGDELEEIIAALEANQPPSPHLIADRLAYLKFNSCTCNGLRGDGQHEENCQTDIINDACAALRAPSPQTNLRGMTDAEHIEDLRLAAKAIRTYMPETLPADGDGKIHFARALAEAAADAIEAALTTPEGQNNG